MAAQLEHIHIVVDDDGTAGQWLVMYRGGNQLLDLTGRVGEAMAGRGIPDAAWS